MDQPSDSDDYELMPKKDIDRLRKEISTIKKNPYGISDKGQDLQQSIERLNATMNKLIAILQDAQQDIIDEYQESKPVEKLNQILDQNETIARALVAINDGLKRPQSQASNQATQAPQSQLSRSDDVYPDFSMPQDKPLSPLQNAQYQPNSGMQPSMQSGMPNMQPNMQPGMQFSNAQQMQQQGMQPMQQQGMQPINSGNIQGMNTQGMRPQFQTRQQMPQPGMPPMNMPQQYPQQYPQPGQQQFGNMPPLDGLSMDNIPSLDSSPDAMLPEKKKKFLGLI